MIEGKKSRCVKKCNTAFTIRGLICIRKNMSRFLKLKMMTGEKNMIIKIIADKANKADVPEKEDEDKTDQELPPWIKMTKSRSNEIKDVITRANESKLTTRLGKRNITLKDAKKLLEDVISGKIDKKEAKKCTTILLRMQMT